MSHISVLLHETVDSVLAGRNTGIYVDATFGRGGHAQLLLSKLDANAQLYAFDKDPQALAVAEQLAQQGLANSGYAETTKTALYNTYQ